ncbi:hypothetical protein JXB41_06325 [Candidatus Woesearchaeota archaeon]|nr:hypothetical protein [Candidatus Woesearchaeota archaeon]
MLIIVLIAYLYLRDSAANNFRRAKKHHKLAEKYYDSGRPDEAKEHYLLSNHFREKAEKQLKGEY